jgi:tryptophanyl-tRNA synthetase
MSTWQQVLILLGLCYNPAMKKTLISGVKPTGTAHIGNYFGAMKQMVDLQNSGDYSCLIMVADYHALNFIQNADEMRKLTLELTMDYLAIGLDPKKSVIFKQSDVPAHTELTWIFDTIVTVPYLERAHAFKDAEAKNKEINVGTFNYPVLMASDILLYSSDVVPVGQDQKQHIEYARDIALKFNHIFKSETFKLPEPLIMDNVATVPGIDGRKMSKSYGNTIPLFATREEIQKAVMSIVTDSGGPEAGGIPMNIYNIHRLIKTEAELKPIYDANKGKYKALKDALIEDLETFIKPMRERRAELAKDEKKVWEILKNGAEQANKIASAKLEETKKAIGVL